MKDRVEFKEVVELFTLYTINDINSGDEVPRIKFEFNKETEALLTNIMMNPFKREGWVSSNIKIKDIAKVMTPPDYSCPIIKVKDSFSFFDYLTSITNRTLRLYEIFGDKRIPREHCQYLMKRIWLRMGVNDFNNVEEFLKRQSDFLLDETLNEYRFERFITKYYGYDVEAKLRVNRSWDESTRRMSFKIYDKDKENYHSLPSILYDIDGDTCYIYGIQNENYRELKKSTKIERLLYKLNKGIENPTVHPSRIFSMILFTDILKNTNIKTIKVPTLQVFSYDYHEMLSQKQKITFSKKWTAEKLEKTKKSSFWRDEYIHDINWYHNIVNKQDTISRSKTEKLIDTVYRVVSSDEDLTLISDIDITDELIIKMNNKVKRK